MADLMTKCEVCHSLLDEEDLFCANCGTEAPGPEQAAQASESSRTATHNFQCSGCGASMSYDAKAEALRCPFCGSVDMVQQGDARILAPNRVVPFRVEKNQAVSAMRRWLGNSFWRPGDLAKQARVVEMTPVYVPYWVFEARTHTYWTADSSRTPVGARGDWYPMSGEHRGEYSGMLVGASGALTPAETSRLCPFDLSDAVPPEGMDLDNVTVEQFSLPRKYARPLARQGLEAAEAETCVSRYVPGRARNVHVNVRIQSMSSEPVLLPVWIMAYRFGDQLFRFLVNGQTGRSTGEAPLSWTKILVVAGIVLLVALLVLGLASGAMGAELGSGEPKTCKETTYAICLAWRDAPCRESPHAVPCDKSVVRHLRGRTETVRETCNPRVSCIRDRMYPDIEHAVLALPLSCGGSRRYPPTLAEMYRCVHWPRWSLSLGRRDVRTGARACAS
jgi:DNA-directed RNA polymerase subunit RPC12/RpoP